MGLLGGAAGSAQKKKTKDKRSLFSTFATWSRSQLSLLQETGGLCLGRRWGGGHIQWGLGHRCPQQREKSVVTNPSNVLPEAWCLFATLHLSVKLCEIITARTTADGNAQIHDRTAGEQNHRITESF